MKYLLSVIVFVTLNVLVRSQNGGIGVKIKQYGPIKAEMGDQVNLTCITNFNFTYSQGSFEGCRWINTRFDAKEQCEMDQNTYGSDFDYCMRWKQKQYTCLVSCQQRFITSTLVNRIEVQARLLILMKKFPHFPIARPLFYSVLLMLARLFGPVLLFLIHIHTFLKNQACNIYPAVSIKNTYFLPFRQY